MNYKQASLAVAVFAIAACSDAPTSAPLRSPQPEAAPELAKIPEGQAIPGQYIVVFRSDVSDPDARTRLKLAKHGGRLKHTYQKALKGFAAELSAQAAAELAADPDVAFVEPDQVMSISTTEANATWGLDRVDQRARPLSGTFTYTNSGAGVTAYIIDTGILFAHSEFGGRAVTGFDAVTSGGSAQDCHGHGTHVSGTVGGTKYGVAKGVRLVAVRVLNCSGSGSTSGVIAGVDWVASHHATPAVANMSLGGGASTALDNAVANAIASGVTFGIAAGNGNAFGIAQNACNSSPARVGAAITVGATDSNDRKASWSNYGSCLDIFAPGVGITSAWYTSSTATNTISGTSMATPHVVGVAAQYLQTHASATPQQVRDALVAASTTNVVVNRGANSPNRLLFTSF